MTAPENVFPNQTLIENLLTANPSSVTPEPPP
jgi:hypothetical protein